LPTDGFSSPITPFLSDHAHAMAKIVCLAHTWMRQAPRHLYFKRGASKFKWILLLPIEKGTFRVTAENELTWILSAALTHPSHTNLRSDY